MLNQNSLAQLKGLKNKMESEKEWAQATIKGTQARYGFAILDDGREILVPPDEMLKTFPCRSLYKTWQGKSKNC